MADTKTDTPTAGTPTDAQALAAARAQAAMPSQAEIERITKEGIERGRHADHSELIDRATATTARRNRPAPPAPLTLGSGAPEPDPNRHLVDATARLRSGLPPTGPLPGDATAPAEIKHAGDFSVDELKAYIADADRPTVERLLAEETDKDGGNRSTAEDALKARLDELSA